MCGRYVSKVDASLEREWELIRAPGPFESFNVAPTTQVPIVRQGEAGRECEMVRWGLIPHWAKGKPGKYSTINARCETMQTAASYRGPWKRGQRCLFPVSGFYEWQVTESGKQPWYIHLAKQETFALAGLWERSADVESATIVTMPANELMAQIHNTKKRMPLVLDPEAFSAWLGDDRVAAQSLLQSYPSGRMEAWPVSTYVNKPANNDKRCIEPVQIQA